MSIFLILYFMLNWIEQFLLTQDITSIFYDFTHLFRVYLFNMSLLAKVYGPRTLFIDGKESKYV